MEDYSIIGGAIFVFTALFTYQGLSNFADQQKYKFDVDAILIRKEYYRLISSGFLHGSWLHFGFNMIALLSFSKAIESAFGMTSYLLIYFLALIGGNLLALYIHRNHGDYTAVGASGAVSGIVSAYIVLYPMSKIEFILIPIGFTCWIFGFVMILITLLAIKAQSDNIGHEAHLGGIIVGILATIVLDINSLIMNWWVVLVLLFPIIIFFYLILRRPEILITKKWNTSSTSFKTNARKEISIDDILDKINAKGINSLTKKEREVLDRHSTK